MRWFTADEIKQMVDFQMPDHLTLRVVPCTPLYRRNQGEQLRFSPTIQEVRDGHGIAFCDNHDTWEDPFKALQSGLRQVARLCPVLRNGGSHAPMEDTYPWK